MQPIRTLINTPQYRALAQIINSLVNDTSIYETVTGDSQVAADMTQPRDKRTFYLHFN
jgi:hypothetical protein